MFDCQTAEAGRKAGFKKKKNSSFSLQKGFFFAINHESMWDREQPNLSWIHNLGKTWLKVQQVNSIWEPFSKCSFHTRWVLSTCRQRALSRRMGAQGSRKTTCGQLILPPGPSSSPILPQMYTVAPFSLWFCFYSFSYLWSTMVWKY